MKKLLKRLLVLLFIFVAAVAAVLFFTRNQEQETVYAVMSEATLPVVTMEFEGSAVNTLHGYTQSMDIPYMRDTITPLPQDRRLPFRISTYGNELRSIEFEVRSLDGENLIESGTCDTYAENGDAVQAELTLQDLLERGREYVLVLKLRTDDWDPAYYYTRIRYYDDTHIGEQIAFASRFSELTFTKESPEEITAQLETDSAADNSSFGYTDIKSSYRQVTWGDLNPSRTGEIRMDIKELNEMVASVQLTYQITAQNESGGTDSYWVREFLCVRYVSGKLWLIAYERTVDQTFSPSDQTIQGGTVDLGVIGSRNLPVELESAGNYTVFVADGELWGYDQASNEALRLFSFKQENDDGIRTLYDQHRFRVISVSENGDVAFTVYGYMNRGSHEGRCGLVFYQYSREENAVREVFFIPSDKPYQVLKEEIGTLSYVGSNNLFYLMFGNSIYAIDFSGEEYVEIISGLREGAYVISEDSSAVAWQEEEDIYGGKTIHIFYMDDGTDLTIHADEGETIRALGFINGDFIYGKARESEIQRNGLVVHYPMYVLEIMDRNMQVLTTYQRDGIYISGVQVEDGKIRISRETRNEDGSFSAAADDALLQNQASADQESVVTSQYSDTRRTTYTLNLSGSGNTENVLSITTPKETVGEAGRELNLVSTAQAGAEDSQYYAYACGRLQGIRSSANEAIALVYDQMGVVVDSRSGQVWTRANRSTEALIDLGAVTPAASQEESLSACLSIMLRLGNASMDVNSALAEGKTAYEILNEAFSGGALNLQGCSINQILYYVDQGYPVLALTEGNRAELIVGYDAYTNLIIYDPLTGTTYVTAQDTAEAYYASYGYPFVSWVQNR